MSPRVTGIPRLLMDRQRRYVVAYVGRRWEVVAVESDDGSWGATSPDGVARKRSADAPEASGPS